MYNINSLEERGITHLVSEMSQELPDFGLEWTAL